MLYVVIGLAFMFGGFTFVGLQYVQQAIRLVYTERLNTAYATVGIFNREFLHVTEDVKGMTLGLSAEDRPQLDATAQDLFEHLSKIDSFPFFQITGVWILSDDGRLLAEAGKPQVAASGSELGPIVSSVSNKAGVQFTVLPAADPVIEGVPFVTLVTRIASGNSSPDFVIAVHTVSLNNLTSYVPNNWYLLPTIGSSSTQSGNIQDDYHLEIMDSRGITILGIGKDENPGHVSVHFATVRNFMTEGKAVTILHKPGNGDTFEPHVMAVVPFVLSGSYLILEQPVDVSLMLPIEMQQHIILLAILGFIGTLLVAWVTTRHVVKPTERLKSAAVRMAQGDLESIIEVGAQDEVGKLAESLDTMRQRLLAAYQQMQNSNKDLESQVRERTARLGIVLQKVISAQEEERYGLARELHDETAQTLGALSIALDRARDALESDDTQAHEHISNAKAIASRLLEETRRLIADLRPQVLDDIGLGPAIRCYVEAHLEEQGVETTVDIDQPTIRLPAHIEVSLFRVIQEAVNNIAKHANAKHARVCLSYRGSTIRAVITDDGKGFNPNRAMELDMRSHSVGLLGMSERVSLLKGNMQVRSKEGEGTEISIDISILEELT